MKLQDLFRLDGKVALVTGGGRGLGRFIATGLAEAGADLVIASRKAGPLGAAAAELAASHGVRVHAIPCDVGKEADIQALFEATVERCGRIDILVNNAGITWGAPTLDYPLAQWDRLFAVNVRGVWLLSQLVAGQMKDQGGGSIINISSVMGFRGTDEDLLPTVPYNATKAAIQTLTRDLAVKLASHHIRVNAIAPGFFDTDMMAWAKRPEARAVQDRLLASIPLRRQGGADDIKGLAVFLASPAAAYVTGQVIVVDGGLLARL